MAEEKKVKSNIFALRTTANREDQVMDFVYSKAKKKGLDVFSIIRPHGMRGYIFLEAASKSDAEQAAFNIPYARGILPKIIDYAESNAVDLIAMSTHGRSGIGRWVFGSVTDKVLHAGNTPVLVVRATS